MSHEAFISFCAVLIVGVIATAFSAITVRADHSWGGYHWSRSAPSFTLQLGDNVTSAWDSYLSAASVDWSYSSILDTTIVPGKTTARRCAPVKGRVEICNSKYGQNGWLGIASVWVSGGHITQGTVKMNDTYFSSNTGYNTPAWKQFVMCQEIGHTFGLAHQDENFSNTNLGSCMDYTNNPDRNDGAGNNRHPNQHDYDMLRSLYSHSDASTSTLQMAHTSGQSVDEGDPRTWGREVRTSSDGRTSVYERRDAAGEQVFTFVVWADEERHHEDHHH